MLQYVLTIACTIYLIRLCVENPRDFSQKVISNHSCVAFDFVMLRMYKPSFVIMANAYWHN